MAFLCAACAGPVEPYADPALRGSPACPSCRTDPLLGGRYRLEEIIGRGAMGVTYRATRLADGGQVAVKELPLRQRPTLKEIELFEREAAVLRQLSHPGIPAYLEDFTSGSGKSFALYLVQELIAGRTVAEEMTVHRSTEAEVLALVDELLGVLGYLHGLSPPVVHRDLKPENIMRRSSGGLVLLDFGSVREALVVGGHGTLAGAAGGSTVTGTFGFMAPEQLRGEASPASDLYALGVLALVLLTRRRPETLMDAHNVLCWRELELGGQTRWLLERLLQAEPSRRPQSALSFRTELSARLRPPAAAPRPAPTPAPRPTSDGLRLAPLQSTTPPPGLWPVLAVTSVLAFGGVMALVGVTRRATPPKATCGASPCQPVPRGIGGLHFGMTIDQARAALPALKEADLPVHTTVFGLPATCALEFPLRGQLSRMKCTVDPVPTLVKHRAQEELLIEQLTRAHGQPAHRQASHAVLVGDHGSYNVWRDDQAELEVRSFFRPAPAWQAALSHLPGAARAEARSELVLTNLAHEHRRRQSEIQLAREQADRQARQERRQALDDQVRREKQRLEKSLGAPAVPAATSRP